jgi:hypothetical protein
MASVLDHPAVPGHPALYLDTSSGRLVSVVNIPVVTS